MVKNIGEAVGELRFALGHALDADADPVEVNREVADAWSTLYELESGADSVVGVDFVVKRLSEARRRFTRWVVLRASERVEHPDFPQQPTPSVRQPVLAAPLRDGEDIVIPCLMDKTENNLYGFSLPLLSPEGLRLPVEEEVAFAVFERSRQSV